MHKCLMDYFLDDKGSDYQHMERMGAYDLMGWLLDKHLLDMTKVWYYELEQTVTKEEEEV